MPIAVEQERLAAIAGDDPKRAAARRAVALDFFQRHIFEAGEPWEIVQRALQCIDVRQPVVIGPPPAPPRQLVALPPDGWIGAGFFAEKPPAELDSPVVWVVSPDARFLKFFAPYVADPAIAAGAPGDARYFIPAARRGSSMAARPA